MGSSLAAAILLSADATVRTQALPGKAAGTEQWIVELRTRGFDLRQKLAEARGMPTQAERRQKLLELRQLAALDQAAFAADLQAAGGAVRRHLWVVNALVADIPTARLDWARMHARVRRLWPNEARAPSSVAVDGVEFMVDDYGPLDAYNHNITAAWAVPQPNGATVRGDGVTIAVFDTGLDRNQTSNTGSLDVYEQNPPAADPHEEFEAESGHFVNQGTLPIPGTSNPVIFTRLWESFRASIDADYRDVNDYWQPPAGTAARHGTGVAGIAAGIPVISSSTGLPLTWTGHAPRSLLVGWSITEWAQQYPSCSNVRWYTTAARYLAAVEDLRVWLALDPVRHRTHVLNVSFDGWPDPGHPVSMALDALSSDPTADILVVVAAGNEGDATFSSHGGWNAMSVGSVHLRLAGGAEPYYPMIDTSRGPLVSDRSRLFPDVCATGAGNPTQSYWSGTWPNLVPGSLLSMPLVDSNTSTYQARGTSMAAPQVSGAAALYRARRLAWSPVVSDSALETKAALLLNVDDPYSKSPSTQPWGPYPLPETTYSNRNTYGVGYTRDDWLVEYAERLPAMNPLGQSVTFGPTTTQQTVSYNVTGGQRHAVVAAWFYPAHLGGDYALANVDLEVREGSTLLARSVLTSSSFERVVFKPQSTGSVTLKLTLPSGAAGHSFDVFLAGRELPAAMQATPPFASAGATIATSQGPSCSGDGATQAVTRTIPTSYANAYGSVPIANVLGSSGAGASPPYGMDLNNIQFNTIIASQVVGGDFDAVGIAFRTWRPFRVAASDLNIVSLTLYETPDPPGSVQDPSRVPGNGGNIAVNVTTVINSSQSNPTKVALSAPSWAAGAWDTWTVVIPFQQPFSFRGGSATPARNLGILMKMMSGNGLSQRCEVDWIGDGAADPLCGGIDYYATHFGGYQNVWRGDSPVFGLIEDVPASNLPPALGLIGEPRILDPIRFRIEQLPAGALAILNFGYYEDNVPLPSGCALLTTIDATQNLTVTSPWTVVDWPAFTAPQALNLDLHWQVVAQYGQPIKWTTSNALTVRLGGLHQ